jgi:hypothetical protein
VATKLATSGTELLDNHHFDTLVTSGNELTAGKHYWEVTFLMDARTGSVVVGVTRPNLEPNVDYADSESTNAWFICNGGGGLWANGKLDDQPLENPAPRAVLSQRRWQLSERARTTISG